MGILIPIAFTNNSKPKLFNKNPILTIRIDGGESWNLDHNETIHRTVDYSENHSIGICINNKWTYRNISVEPFINIQLSQIGKTIEIKYRPMSEDEKETARIFARDSINYSKYV